MKKTNQAMKRGLVILAIFSVLLLAGCTQDTGLSTGLGSFLGGTDGVTFNFVADEPPATVLDAGNQPFFITLEFQNDGEYAIQEGDILTTLSGIQYSAFSIDDPNQKNQNALEKGFLNKQTGEIVEGGIDQISYEGDYHKDLAYDLPFTISANYCYKYQTQAVASMCLSKQPTRRAKENDVCMITEQKEVGNSGAPLQVTSFSERASGQDEVTVTFKIENMNTGEAYAPGFIDTATECITDDRERGKVNVAVQSEQQVDIACPKLGGGQTGEVRLINGQTTITCRVNTNQLAEAIPFNGAFDIQLDYTYKDHLATDITVENAIQAFRQVKSSLPPSAGAQV